MDAFGPRSPGTVPQFLIRKAGVEDVPVIVRFIHALAEYERLSHERVATEEGVRSTVFGEPPAAEVALAGVGGNPGGNGPVLPELFHLSREAGDLP